MYLFLVELTYESAFSVWAFLVQLTDECFFIVLIFHCYVLFCILKKGLTPTIRKLCFVLLNSILFNLLIYLFIYFCFTTHFKNFPERPRLQKSLFRLVSASQHSSEIFSLTAEDYKSLNYSERSKLQNSATTKKKNSNRPRFQKS